MDMKTHGRQVAILLGMELKGAIASHGHTVGGVAEALGIERSTLSRYLSGRRDIPGPMFVLAAELIGVPAGTLIERAMARADLAWSDLAVDVSVEDEVEIDVSSDATQPQPERDQ